MADLSLMIGLRSVDFLRELAPVVWHREPRKFTCPNPHRLPTSVATFFRARSHLISSLASFTITFASSTAPLYHGYWSAPGSNHPGSQQSAIQPALVRPRVLLLPNRFLSSRVYPFIHFSLIEQQQQLPLARCAMDCPISCKFGRQHHHSLEGKISCFLSLKSRA